MKKFLKWASVCNLIVGGLILLTCLTTYSPMIFVLGVVELVLGFYYAQCANQEVYTLYQNRGVLLLVGILNFIPNFISSVFVFTAYDKIRIEYKKGNYKKKRISKKRQEQIKLNRILNVGVGLVLLAGYLFLNSTITVKQPWFLVLVMLLFSGIFYALYLFNHKHIQNQYSLWVYHILSMFFLLVGYFSIGKYGLFGEWFSFAGEGKDIVLMLFFLLLSFLSWYSYQVFKNKAYLYGVYAGFFLAPIYYLGYTNVDMYVIVLAMSLVLTIVSMLEIKNTDIQSTFRQFLKVASYILVFALIIGTSVQNSVIYILAVTLSLCNLYYLNVYHATKTSTILTTIFALCLCPSIIFHLHFDATANISVLLLSYALLFIALLLNKETKSDSFFHRTSMIGLNFYALFIYIFSFAASFLAPVLVSLVALFFHFVYLSIYDHKMYAEYYLQPLKLGLLLYACFYFLRIFDASIIFTVISIVFLVAGCLTVEKKLKWTYLLTLFATLMLAFIMTVYTGNKIGGFVLLVVTLAYTYYIRNNKDTYIKSLYPAAYVILILFFYEFLSIENIFQFQPIYNHILVMLALVSGLFMNTKDKQLLQVTSLAFLFPMINILLDLNKYFFMQDIFVNLLSIVLVLLLCEKGIRNDRDKNIVSTLFIALLLINIIFTNVPYVSIYVSIVTVLLMFFSIYRPAYNTLFVVSIGAFILNIMLYLENILAIIPLWIYLLIMGLVVIGLVTYQETHKGKKKTRRKKSKK